MEKNNTKLPKTAKFILRRILPDFDSEYLLDDMENIYCHKVKENGLIKAGLWLLKQIIKSTPQFIFYSIRRSMDMFGNYLKITARTLKRKKGYTFINIFGLAVGMAVSILILLWVNDELNYDRFHKNSDYLYRVIAENQKESRTELNARTPMALSAILKNDYPEIINSARYMPDAGFIVNYKNRKLTIESSAWVDASFFEMFSFEFIKGDKSTALSDPSSIILTERISGNIFGDEDPVGKVITVVNQPDMTVTGVIKDLPKNSHIQFDCIGPLPETSSWRWTCYTYVQIRKNSKKRFVDTKISGAIKRHNSQLKTDIHLQPLNEIYFNSHLILYGRGGEIKYVYIFSALTVFTLMIACINFMNLSTARSASRAKEIGLRKVVGANRKDLIKQFFGESLILSFTALIFASAIAAVMLPAFNTISMKELKPEILLNTKILTGLILLALVTGFVSGSYPALLLSNFRPHRVLKGISGRGTANSKLRKILVTAQFALSISLIICTFIIYNQLQFIRNKNLGFDKENLVHIMFEDRNSRINYEGLKEELLKNPKIIGIARGYSPMNSGIARQFGATANVNWDGKDPGEEITFYRQMVGFGYLELLGIELLEGRYFSKDYSGDIDRSYILNESAAKVMNMESPVGKRIVFQDNPGTIIGIVKDYHISPLHYDIEPVIIKVREQNGFLVRIKNEDISNTIGYMRNLWENRVSNTFPFNFTFIDERIDSFYRNEQRLAEIFKYFACFTIIISALGLFGLASFSTEQRTKEIGIRKVLGASISNIMRLLVKEFIILVVLGNTIAWPVSYYFMNKWLSNFAYKMNPGALSFIFSGLLTLFTALITVSYRTFKAAVANPVDSIRNE